jgi:hypothetical protein
MGGLMGLVSLLLLVPAASLAQEGTLDLLDGETLYARGWLFTVGYDLERKRGLLEGDSRVPDPERHEELHQAAVLATHYGLRHDLQLSLVLPYLFVAETLESAGGRERLDASGPGDLAAIAKWRFWRWDGPHQALNLAALAGLKFPTGSDDEKEGGLRLRPDLQPGSGSWDPLAGLACTYEPYRWRFNGAFSYQKSGENSDGFSFGDRIFAELAAGNRFWLEPYPGPFLRGDLLLRYRGEGRASRPFTDLGGDLLTAGATLAFRPQPALDLQLTVEFPLYQRLFGTQTAEEFRLSLAFGYRI